MRFRSVESIRAVAAAALAAYNNGTPINPGSTWQQLSDLAQPLIRQPASDTEAIFTYQLMFMLSSTTPLSGPVIRAGIGHPENVITAVPGSIYFDITTPGDPIMYIKSVGNGATGWV